MIGSSRAPSRCRAGCDLLPVTAVATFLLLAVGNMISTALLCGVGFCPENPGGYLIFNDNLRVTMFAGAL